MARRDLWPRVEPLLSRVERPARYLNHEWGSSAPVAEGDFAFCMIYPDTYELGQANQAVRILVNAVNATDGMGAERAFLPAVDMADLMREEGVPLFSLESCRPVADFDVVGITLPHELAATNVLETLDLAGIPLRTADRAEGDPIVLAGGPCAYNPEPYAPFFDVILVGEGEEQLPETLALIRELRASGAPRAEILREVVRRVGGAYVPSLYRWRSDEEAQAAGSWAEPLFDDVPCVVHKRVFEGFADSPALEPMIVPYTEVVHDRLNVEILRGCARGCRFCQAGMMYRPVRERSADNIVDAVARGLAETGYDEVSLTSLSSTDHSRIAEILSRVNADCAGAGVRVSVPSQRLDAFGVEMAELVAGQKKGGLTFAPEAGTQRLRDVINKNVTEENLETAARNAFELGWRRCKLYFMMGLPTETDEDIVAIAEAAERVLEIGREVVGRGRKSGVSVSISVAVFVPKSYTAFQWAGQLDPEEVRRRQQLLLHSCHDRAIRVSYHDSRSSLVEGAVSKMGREGFALVRRAWELGCRFDAWTSEFDFSLWEQAAADCGLDLADVACESFPLDARLPWDHTSPGVSKGFLQREWRRAALGVTTPDCTRTSCVGCGVCPTLGVANVIQEARA